MPDALTPEQLAAMAATPAAASADGTSVTAKSADDVIKLDQYAAQKKAAGVRDGATGRRASPFQFLQPVQAVPPGGL